MKVKELYKLVERDYVLNGRTSLAACQHHVRRGLAHFGEMDAESVTASDIEQYQHDRIAEGAARATVNNELGFLKRGYRLALRLEKLTRAPYIQKLRLDNARSGFVTVEEFCRLRTTIKAASPIAADVVLWLYGIGWRAQEVMALAWAECDVQAGLVTLPTRRSKTRAPRRIKLPPILHDSLRLRWIHRNGPFVFHRRGRQVKSIRRSWHNARNAVGKPGLYLHDLRRSWATNAIQAGVPQPIVMQVGGWRSVSTFLRYVIVNERAIEQALSQVADYNSGKPNPAS